MRRHNEILGLIYCQMRKHNMRNEIVRQCMADKKFI